MYVIFSAVVSPPRYVLNALVMLAARSLSFLQSVIFFVLAAPAVPADTPTLMTAMATSTNRTRRMFPPGDGSVRAPARDRMGISALPGARPSPPQNLTLTRMSVG